MSYSVFVHRFASGEPAPIAFEAVVAILAPHGTIGESDGFWEFTPHRDGLCEVGILSGSPEEGVLGVHFERPAAGGGLADLVFGLLGIDGCCYFEQDCTEVLARSDLSAELPAELLDLCDSGSVTVVRSAAQIAL